MFGEVHEQESVWRSVVFPVAFKISKKQQQLSSKNFYKLYSEEGRPYVFEMSLARQRCAPTLEMVHRFGCRLASFQNKAQARRGKIQDRVYCGAYELIAREVLALKDDAGLSQVKTIELFHSVENGEFAHANLRIEVDTNGDEEAVEPIKTEIVDRLWRLSAGPEKYVCLRDERLQPHPSELLSTGHRGRYVERRTKRRIALEFLLYATVHFPRLLALEVTRKLRSFI